MKRLGLTPLLVLAAIAVALMVAARFSPVFPGDRELAAAIQSAFPTEAWPRALTRAAGTPWIYGVLALSAIGAFRVAGWRGAAAMGVTLLAFTYVEEPLKQYIGRPRPSAGSMMAGASTGFSMPSGFALKFGSTVGLLGAMALMYARGVVRSAYVIGALVVLVAGLVARVTLRAHWPSDVIAGYLLAITVGLGLYELLKSLGATSPKPLRKSAARR